MPQHPTNEPASQLDPGFRTDIIGPECDVIPQLRQVCAGAIWILDQAAHDDTDEKHDVTTALASTLVSIAIKLTRSKELHATEHKFSIASRNDYPSVEKFTTDEDLVTKQVPDRFDPLPIIDIEITLHRAQAVLTSLPSILDEEVIPLHERQTAFEKADGLLQTVVEVIDRYDPGGVDTEARL